MYKNNEFHESYFYHTCLIVPEKDVLETDIVGSGCATYITRWWNDLFLLSYTNGRSIGFYKSSHDMRIERFKQFRKYKHRIHPMSKFRNFWDFLILHVLIINKILFRFTSTFLFDNLPICLFYIGALSELIIIADLYVNLKTGYIKYEAKRVILDSEKCLVNYCTKKLFLHYASAMPLHWFMFLRFGSNITCGMCKTNRFICALKIISIFSLYRVFETSSYWTQKCHSANLIYLFKFMRIGAVGIATMCQFYDLSDVVTLLVFLGEGKVAESSSLAIRAGFKYSTLVSQMVPNYMFICFDISRIFKALLLFNFRISEKFYYLDKMTALVSYIFANTFYVWSLLLPDELRTKVQQYFDFEPTKIKMMEQNNELWRSLPDVLKKEAKLSYYLKPIRRIPFFKDLPVHVLEKIALLLELQIFLINDIVAEAWVQANGLMIVDNGVLAVYSQHHEEQGHLIDGDYFGGVSLFTDKELCMSYVVSVTPCTILFLEKNCFREMMRQYPKLFTDLKMNAIKKYSHTNSLVTSRRESDLSQPTPVEYLYPKAQ